MKWPWQKEDDPAPGASPSEADDPKTIPADHKDRLDIPRAVIKDVG